MRPSILLVGAGGHALACLDVIEADGSFEIGGLVGSAGEVGKQVLDYRVLGTDADLPQLAARFQHALVAVGQIKSPEPRRRLFELLRGLGCKLPSIVSPHAFVSRHAKMGAGCIVMHGAIVNAGATIGDNCIVNSQSLIEHGVVIGAHCHIATGAIVNGDARVGAQCFIGSGAVVREGVAVGESCVIGMGQLVTKNCASGARVPEVRT